MHDVVEQHLWSCMKCSSWLWAWRVSHRAFVLLLQLTQITRTGQSSWESKNILAVSFAPLVQQSRTDGCKPEAVVLRESPPLLWPHTDPANRLPPGTMLQTHLLQIPLLTWFFQNSKHYRQMSFFFSCSHSEISSLVALTSNFSFILIYILKRMFTSHSSDL